MIALGRLHGLAQPLMNDALFASDDWLTATGETVDELLEGYPPEFTEEHVRAAIAYADRVPFVEDPDARPWRKAAANKSAA